MLVATQWFLYGYSMTQDIPTHSEALPLSPFPSVSLILSLRMAQIGTSGLKPLLSLPTSLWHKEALSWEDNQAQPAVSVVALCLFLGLPVICAKW